MELIGSYDLVLEPGSESERRGKREKDRPTGRVSRVDNIRIQRIRETRAICEEDRAEVVPKPVPADLVILQEHRVHDASNEPRNRDQAERRRESVRA